MKKFRNFLSLAFVFTVVLALFGADRVRANESAPVANEGAGEDSVSGESLEDQLKALQVPADKAPVGVSSEQLYSVQTRNSPLGGRLEVTLGGGTNLSGTNAITSRQAQGGLRFHFSDRWSLGATYGMVFNELSSAAQKLLDQQGIIPDIPYAKSRADLTVGFNTFYGKLRWGMESVTYFDQFINLGMGEIALNTGTVNAGVVEAGFVAWLGKWGSLRLSVKDYIYQERSGESQRIVNDWHGMVNFGVLLL